MPAPATVLTVAYGAAFWALLAVAAQLLFAVVLVPLLPGTIEIEFSSTASANTTLAAPAVLAVIGWGFVGVGTVATLWAVVLTRTGRRGAYAFGVATCVVMPAFAGNVLGNAFAALNGLDPGVL
jgi:hypothetical protein